MKSIKQDKKKTIGENIGVHCTFIIVCVCVGTLHKIETLLQ